jgi:hypothetical protein
LVLLRWLNETAEFGEIFEEIDQNLVKHANACNNNTAGISIRNWNRTVMDSNSCSLEINIFRKIKFLKKASMSIQDEIISHLDASYEKRLGWLVMSPEGIIKNSSGDLKDKVDVARNILAALRDSRDLLGANDEKNFQRMCIRYRNFQYAVQLSPDGTVIAVVKDKV